MSEGEREGNTRKGGKKVEEERGESARWIGHRLLRLFKTMSQPGLQGRVFTSRFIHFLPPVFPSGITVACAVTATTAVSWLLSKVKPMYSSDWGKTPCSQRCDKGRVNTRLYSSPRSDHLFFCILLNIQLVMLFSKPLAPVTHTATTAPKCTHCDTP